MLNVLAGYDRLDIASVEHAPEDYVAALKQPVNGFRIGVARAPFFDLLDADVATVVDDALRVLAKLTKSMTDTMLPSTRDITRRRRDLRVSRGDRSARAGPLHDSDAPRAAERRERQGRPSTSAAGGGSSCCAAPSTMRSRTSIWWCCRPAGARRARWTPRSSARRPTCRATPSSRTPAPSTSTASRRSRSRAASRRRGCRSG